MIYTLPATANQVFLEDDGTSGNGMLQLRSGNGVFDTTIFADPTGSLTINRGNAADTITIDAIPEFTASLTIGATGIEFGTVTFASALTLAANKSLAVTATGTISLPNATSDLAAGGTGTITLTTARDIKLSIGSSIAAEAGDIRLSANQQSLATTTAFIGLDAFGTSITTTGGNVDIRARAGDTGDGNVGIHTESARIQAGGNGSVTLVGTGGPGSGILNHGMNIAGGTIISSSAANVSLTGIGGGAGGYGIIIEGNSQVSVGSVALLNVAGSGTGSGAIGVVLANNSKIASGGGPVVVIGTAASAYGISLYSGTIGGVSSDSVTLIADDMYFHPSTTITAGTHIVTLRQKTDGRGIQLGNKLSFNQLQFDSQELSCVTASTLNIGDAHSGAIDVTAAILRPSRTDMYLTSGDSIDFTSGYVFTAGGNLRLAPGDMAGVTASNAGMDFNVGAIGGGGSLGFAGGSALAITINGKTIDSQYQQLNVLGKVDLTGVRLTLSGNYTPVVGDKFTIVSNDGGDAITGTFNGLSEGQVFSVSAGRLASSFQITYRGGDGNDVVITAVDPTNPTLQGTSGDDNWLVKRNNANLEVTLNNTLLWSTSFDSLTSLTINSLAGNDTLTVDLSGGDAIPLNNITFNGGNPTTSPGDKLTITGGDQGTVTYNYSNSSSHDGSVVMSNFGTVNYTGLEPIVNSGTATDVIFNLLGVASSAPILEDDGASGNGLSQLRSTTGTFETTIFANPTGSVLVSGGPVNSITVGDLPDFSAGMILGSNGLPFDRVTFTGALTLAADKSLVAFAKSTIGLPNTTSDISVSGGGSVRLTAGKIEVRDGSSITTFNGNVVLSTTVALAVPGTVSGIIVSGTITTTGTGNILLSGWGVGGYGIYLLDGVIQSTATGIGAGSISLTGYGGNADSDNQGVSIQSDKRASQVMTISGNIEITGTGGGQPVGTGSFVTNSPGVWIIGGATVQSTGLGATAGNITILGTAGGGTSDNEGVRISGTVTTVDGDVSITGKGRPATVGESNEGVLVYSGGVVSSTGTGDSAGNITIAGTGGSGYSNNGGVRVTSSAVMTTVDGDINITGQAGALRIFGGVPSLVSNYGVLIDTNAQVTSSGTGASAGKITIEGSGGRGKDANAGVNLVGSNVMTTVDGDISITGQASPFTTGQWNAGVVFNPNSSISAVGLGKITLVGTGGGGTTNNAGVTLGAVNAVNGDVNITGTAISATGDFEDGVAVIGQIRMNGAGSLAITGTGGGTDGAVGVGINLTSAYAQISVKGPQIDLITDRLASFPGAGFLISALSTVLTIRPLTDGMAIDLGSSGDTASGVLELSAAEFARMSSKSLQIGDANSGPITISADVSLNATAVGVTSGRAITFTGGSISTLGNLMLTPGSAASVGVNKEGVDAAVGSTKILSFGAESDLAIAINGTAVDTEYEQLNVIGQVDLTGVNLVLSGGYDPTGNDSFTIVNNDGDDEIIGEFNDLTDGEVFTIVAGALGGTYEITYFGGDGNDVVLTAINVPPTFDHLTGDYSAADENPATHGPALQQVVVGWATNIVTGPDNESTQVPTFEVTNNNHALFAAQPEVSADGTLTYTPAPNTHGIATVTVVLHDGGGGTDASGAVSITIEITKTHKLHNTAEAGQRNGLDVTGSTSAQPDGSIVAGDVIAVINYINAKGSGHISDSSSYGPPYCDVTGDDNIVAEDALKIINYINSNPGQSEGEFSAATLPEGDDQPSDVISLLAFDIAEQAARRRRQH